MEESIITANTVKNHIRHLPNGIKALELNSRLGESFGRILLTEANLPQKSFIPRSSFTNKVTEMEKKRIKAVSRLTAAVTEMHKQPPTPVTLKLAAAKKPQLQKSKAGKLKDEVQQFHQFLNQLNEQFAQLQASERLKEKSRPFNPKEVKISQAHCCSIEIIIFPEDKSKMTSINELSKPRTAAESVAAYLNALKLATSKPDPNYPLHVKYLLGEVGQLLIPMKDHRLVGNFGKGGQGYVFMAKEPEVGRPIIALKVAEITDHTYLDLINEVRFTSRGLLLNHPNILCAEWCSIFKAPEYGNTFWLAIAFPPMFDGSLNDYTGYNSRIFWPERNIACVMKQVLSALRHIHSMGIIHNDLKPSNILVDGGILKIADFGRAVLVTNLLSANEGTLRWLAPEVAMAKLWNRNANAVRTNAIDIWALGGILFELLVGKRPFHDQNTVDAILTAIADDGLVLPENGKYSDKVKHFFSLMTRIIPQERLSANTLLRHSFIGRACTPKELAESLHQERKEKKQKKIIFEDRLD